jgi:hypothetical protein
MRKLFKFGAITGLTLLIAVVVIASGFRFPSALRETADRDHVVRPQAALLKRAPVASSSRRRASARRRLLFSSTVPPPGASFGGGRQMRWSLRAIA